MPAQSVAVPYNEFLTRAARHDQVTGALVHLDARFQKLVAELVMMRLFDELQEALSGIALRLACGTPYVDGTLPALLTARAASTAGARDLFENYGRAKHKSTKWSRTKFINETTKHVLDPGDAFRYACNANSLVISEMQAVRNRIAHANAGSRKAFAVVVKRHYGAKRNNVSPGMLLLSTQFTPTHLQRYLTACRVIARECAKA